MKRVLVAGEINVDLVLRGYSAFPQPGKEVLVEDSQLVLGSASAILAMGLARLGVGVAFVGKVGEDVWGRFCLQEMASRGIDLSAVVRSERLRTGITVAISSPGDRALVTHLGAIAALVVADVGDEALRGCAHLHVSSYFMQEALRPGCRALFARAHGLGLTTSLDPGFDPSETWGDDLRRTLEEVDLFFPNEVELRGLGRHAEVEECLRRLANGRTRVVAKLGREGAATLEDGRLLQQAALPVEPVDTTGAGDSFDAGFLRRWLDGAPVRECLRLGVACGALATRGLGGTACQPDLAEAEAFLAAHA